MTVQTNDMMRGWCQVRPVTVHVSCVVEICMVFDMMNMVSVLMAGSDERKAVNACVGAQYVTDATV